MSRLRFVKNITTDKPTAPAALNNTVRSIRAVYETDVEIAAALLPKPLVPLMHPEIFVQFAHVAMHVSPEQTIEIGATTVGVRCNYQGVEGTYVLGMYMPGEFICIKGRERFGEPKKISEVDFSIEDKKFDVAVRRHGIDFMQIKGEIGEAKGPAQFEEKFFCYKAMPKISGEQGFDGSCFLTQLNWQRNYTNVYECKGEIILRESPNDPLIDVPVRKLIRLEYAEGATQTSGQILQEVPGDWLMPFFHGRYDEPQEQGVDIVAGAYE
jgi:acetoacetate decarboxylase